MRRTLAMLAVLATLLAACGTADTSPPVTSAATAGDSLSPSEQSGYEVLMLRLAGPDGLSGALAQASAANFAELAIGAPYAPPAALLRYEGTGTATACGPVVPLDATYCAEDRTLAVHEELLRRAYGFFQDTGPMVILAHEWGHHLARQASYSTVGVSEELMADCLAGLFVWRHFPVEFGEPDFRSAAALLFTMGDERVGGSPWFDPAIHGEPAQRVSAFLAGMGGSARLCSAYWSWQPVEPIAVGGYRWIPPPSSTVERQSSNAILLTEVDRLALFQAGKTTAQSAVALLPDAFATTMEGRGQLIGSPLELPMQGGPGGQLGGTAAVQGYAALENGAPAGRGIFLVHLSTTGEALLVRTFDTDLPPNAGVAAVEWAPLRNWTMGIIGGVCPPDGAGVLCASLAAP